MNQVRLCGLMVMLLACGSGRGQGKSTPTEPARRLDELESRLLAADTVRFAYLVSAHGAVEAELAGDVRMVGERIEVTGAGHFQDRPVEVFVRGNGESYEFGNRATHEHLPAPGELREALLIGFTRMGILHNLARLTGAAPPDHADGGVREWVTIDSVTMDSADSAAISFNLTVAGNRAGFASLEIDEGGFPVMRRQTVLFPSGEMGVEERYATVTIHP